MVLANGQILTFKEIDALRTYFNENGIAVGPRNGPNKRTQDQKELYNLRQYLLTLTDHDFLEFPISIEKGESPDFIISYQDQTIGLEITEAPTQDWQKELTQMDKELIGKDTSNLVSLDQEGWHSNSAERETCAAILHAIRRKVRKIRDGKYRKASCYDLLIYTNVRPFFYDRLELANILKPRVSRWHSQWLAVRKVNVITDPYLLFDIIGDFKTLPLSSEKQAIS